MLEKPTLDIARLMFTMGIKKVFKTLDQEGAELGTLCRKNKILRGYLVEVVGPLDPEHPEETLNVVLREGGGVHLDPFLKAYQQWGESFEKKVS